MYDLANRLINDHAVIKISVLDGSAGRNASCGLPLANEYIAMKIEPAQQAIKRT